MNKDDIIGYTLLALILLCFLSIFSISIYYGRIERNESNEKEYKIYKKVSNTNLTLEEWNSLTYQQQLALFGKGSNE